MRGLLWKEFFQLKRTFRTQLFSLVLFTVLGIMVKNTVYLGMMVTVLLTNLALNSLAWDETCSWNRYAMTMPIHRSDLVNVKYLLIYILAGVSFLITSVLNIPVSILSGISMTEGIFTSAACAIVGILSISLNITLCFKFGVEKARMMTILSYLIPFLPLVLVLYLAEKNKLDLSAVTTTQVGLGILIFLLIALAFSQLCRILSCRILTKKDL